VILEDFATLQSSARTLMDAGLLDKGLDLAPTMLLSDLKVVCEILDTPGVLIHYLWRRGHFSKTAKIQGDEMDLLAMYLDTGFEIGDAEYDDTQMNAMAMSGRLDQYFEAKDAGFQPKKPGRELTEWWRDIIAVVEKRRLQQWCDVVIALLCLPYEMQKRMEKRFLRLKDNVRKRWTEPGHLNILASRVGPKGEPFGVALLAFTDGNRHDRSNLAQDAAWQAIGDSNAKWAVVVAQNIDRDEYPYSLLLALEPGEEGDERQNPPAEAG
jgi:hypothetical protein